MTTEITVPLRPSSAGRTVQCPGSLALSRQFPDTSDPEASDEGTLAHEVAHAYATGATHSQVGITDEMIEGAQMWAEVTGGRGHFEKFGMAPQIHPDNGGTPDNWIMESGVTHVRDYKFGHGYVEVRENWQLINYAAIAFHAMGGPTETVEFTIVQPRSYHRDGPIRKWTTTGHALETIYFPKLRAAYLAALGPNPRTYIGPECRYCPARMACPALQAVGYQAIDLARDALPLELSPGAAARELQLIRRSQKLLAARETGLAMQVETLLKTGSRVPGFTLEPTTGRETWAKPIREVIALGQMFGVPLEKPGAITPAQARKAGVPETIVATYAHAPRGALALVEDGLKLAAVFGGDK